MIEYIVPITIFLAVIMLGMGIRSLLASKNSKIDERLSSKKESHAFKDDQEANLPKFEQTISHIGQAIVKHKPSQNLNEKLAAAGFHGSSASTIYMGAKFVSLLVGLLIAAPIMFVSSMSIQARIGIWCGVGGLCFMIPNLIVSSRRKDRYRQISHTLPDAIDLMEICVTAGMGLETAWNMVSDQVRPVCPVLADEMALTNLEIHLGESRSSAMKHMAERTGVEDISSLVAMLTQSERFGSSIAVALQTFASSLRERRSMHIQENAEKAGVKLLFPMVLFIFPVMFFVAAGPAFMRILDMITS